MPGIVNRPSARVTALYVVPDGVWTAVTRPPSRGAPEESVTMPATADVVTPWAATAPAKTTENSKLTIHRIEGPLLSADGVERSPSRPGESGPRGKPRQGR